MATTEFIAAIEPGSSKVSGIAGLKNSDGSIQVLAFACEEAASFVRKGVIYNIDKAAQALTAIVGKLEAQLGSSIAKVYVGIGGQSLRTVENHVSRTQEEESIITNNLIDEICDDNIAASIVDMNILDVAPQEYRIDNALYADPVGVTGCNITGQFLNIVARNTLKRNLERSFEQAGIEIADLFIAPTVLAKAVLTENEMRSGCALVDLGADTTTVAVYKGSILRHLCVIPLGGNNITHDIASLQMEEADAEQLKLQHGDALYEESSDNEAVATCSLPNGHTLELNELNDIVGARVEEILKNVGHQIGMSGYEKELYAGVILTGGACNLKHMEEAFRKATGIEKVRTAQFVQNTVHGCSDQIKREAAQNTLLGLLLVGQENCCKPQQTKPSSEKAPTSHDIFANDEALKQEAAKALAAKKERDRAKHQEEEEKRKRIEEDKKKKKEEKKKSLMNFFGRLTDNILGEDEKM